MFGPPKPVVAFLYVPGRAVRFTDTRRPRAPAKRAKIHPEVLARIGCRKDLLVGSPGLAFRAAHLEEGARVRGTCCLRPWPKAPGPPGRSKRPETGIKRRPGWFGASISQIS